MQQTYECGHCGHFHTGSGACPRIKAIEYYPNGGGVKRIEYHDVPAFTQVASKPVEMVPFRDTVTPPPKDWVVIGGDSTMPPTWMDGAFTRGTWRG